MLNFHRVESATIAHATGNLTYDSWTHDTVLALSMSGIRNPLGFAIVRFLSDTEVKRESLTELLTELSRELVKRGKYDRITETAAEAIAFWNDRRCPKCNGTGVEDFAQTTCKECQGTGQKSSVSLSKGVSYALEVLDEHLTWMERQINTRMKGMTYQENEVKKISVKSGSNYSISIGNGGSVTSAVIKELDSRW